MKQTIFEEQTFNDVIRRIKLLDENSKGRWGKLSSPQMIRHLTEACRMAFDEIKIPDQSNFVSRTLVKWMFLRNIKPPRREKGNIKTFAGIDVIALAIPVSEIGIEIANYYKMLERIRASGLLSNYHPLFGKMSRDDWGYLTYAHADYHLTQFNV
jgi:hypothetical protein